MLNLNSIMVGSMNVADMAAFYEKVFALPPDTSEGGWFGWTVGDVYFSVYEHDKMMGESKDSGRVMFNLETEDVVKEFDRIKNLGAKVIQEPYEMQRMMIATFADPDENYFQLMSPWEGV